MDKIIRTARNLSEDFCDKAFDSLIRGRFNESQKYLDKARIYWTKNPRIAIIQNELIKNK